MKGLMSLGLLAIVLMVVSPRVGWADEEESLNQVDQEQVQATHRVAWEAQLQEKYGLTDEKLAELRSKGLTSPQIAMAAQLAQSSQKPLDEILVMRTEQKMGWGKIAKTLGLKPGELGSAVSSLRKNVRATTQSETRMEKRERNREERQERIKNMGRGKGRN